MAEPEKKAEEEEEAAPPPKPKSGIVGKLINAVGIFVLCLAAVVTGGIINGKLAHPTEYRLDKDGLIKPVVPVVVVKAKAQNEEAKEATGKPPLPALYLKMDPQLVVNFDTTSEVKFLALDIEFLARDQAVLDDVLRNMPKIRNNLLMLIGNRDYKTLMSRAGKDALRIEALNETKRVLKQETGSAKLEDLFFTSFVVQ